jgi:hypothetical protein
MRANLNSFESNFFASAQFLNGYIGVLHRNGPKSYETGGVAMTNIGDMIV